MKITLQECEGCFSFDMTAESIQDAALLTRFGANATNKINSRYVTANQSGSFEGGLVVAKHKRADSTIPKRR